jgi:hypothetical protein
VLFLTSTLSPARAIARDEQHVVHTWIDMPGANRLCPFDRRLHNRKTKAAFPLPGALAFLARSGRPGMKPAFVLPSQSPGATD